MRRRAVAVIAAPLLLAACGQSASAAAGPAPASTSHQAATSAPVPTVVSPPPCHDAASLELEPSDDPASAATGPEDVGADGEVAMPDPSSPAFDQGPVLDMAERVEALAARVPGFTSLAVDSGHQQVEVSWEGEPPQELAALDDADAVVDLVVTRALFSERQLDAASERVSTSFMSPGEPAAFTVSGISACFHGSGIEVEVLGPDDVTPTTVPAEWVARIQRVAGEIPVAVVPGELLHPVAGG